MSRFVNMLFGGNGQPNVGDYINSSTSLADITPAPSAIENQQSIVLYDTKIDQINSKNITNNIFMQQIIKKITEDVFNPIDFPYWENVIIAGGYCTDLVYGINKSNDIDIFIYGTKVQSKIQEIASHIKTITKSTVTGETTAILFLQSGKGKRIQIINATQFSDPLSVICKFDIQVCKIMFNGYDIIIAEEAISEIQNRIIDYNNILGNFKTIMRVAKYVHHKGFGLRINPEQIENIDPLYIFKDTVGFAKFMRYSKLFNDETLRFIRNLVTIRTDFNLKNLLKSSPTDGEEYTANLVAMKDKSLTSALEISPESNEKDFNQFGLHKILYSIKKGQYNLEEIYLSQDSDECGFHVTCYIIMYEPDEEKVIDFIKNIHKLCSKNMNKFKLDYLELAALLSRYEITKYLMHKENYKRVMEIAVKEDNIELYKLAYKLHSSNDRYLYSLEELNSFKAYSIAFDLYGHSEDFQSETRDSKTFEYLHTISIDDYIIKINSVDKKEQDQIKCYIIKNCYRNIIEKDGYRAANGDMPEYETILCNIYRDKINQNSVKNLNKLLSIMCQDEEEYNKYVNYFFASPFRTSSCSDKIAIIKIYNERTIDADYYFDSPIVNNMIAYLDDPRMLQDIHHKKEMISNFLNKYKLGPHLTQFRLEKVLKFKDITIYSSILGNTSAHEKAYIDNILDEDYQRIENAIGYCPDDIILWKTIMFYKNDEYKKIQDYKSLENRRASIRKINRSKPIVEYNGKVTREQVAEIIPGLF